MPSKSSSKRHLPVVIPKGDMPDKVCFDAALWRTVCQLCGFDENAGLAELIEALHKKGVKHGLTRTYEFGILSQAIARCGPNAKGQARKDYYERGITVCDGFHSIENFITILGYRPSMQFSLDRIDNDGGYWCGQCSECIRHNRKLNCRWATRAEQSRNTRRNKFITIAGETKTVTDWARSNGIRVRTAFLRITAGWDPVVAVTQKPIGLHDSKRAARVRAMGDSR